MSELFEKTVRGVMWSAMEHFSVKGVQFLVTLIMARLLLPSDYGLLGLLGVFMSLSSVMIDGGVWQAIVRKQDRTEADFTTMFCFNLGMSVLLYIALFVAAPYIAEFFGYPELCLILRVTSFNLIINAFAIVQKVHLFIDLNFKKLSGITVLNSILSGITGITLAYLGCGVWALVWQGITSSLLYVLFLCCMIRWYPKAPFSKQSFRSMFGFGSKLAISQVIHIIYVDLANLAIGKFYSPSALGVYTRAQHFASFPASSITGVIERVTYPVFCKIGTDEERLKRAFFRYLRVLAIFVFPIMIFLAAVSNPLIAVLLGPKWEYTAELLPLFCISAMLYPLPYVNLSIIKVKGRSDIFLKLEILKKTVGVLLLLSALPFGIKAICYAIIASSFITLFLTMFYTTKVVSIKIMSQMHVLLPALALSVVMGSGVLFVCKNVNNNIIALICSTIVALEIYVLLLFVFKMEVLTDIRRVVKNIHHAS